jgi:hypothetical protein
MDYMLTGTQMPVSIRGARMPTGAGSTQAQSQSCCTALSVDNPMATSAPCNHPIAKHALVWGYSGQFCRERCAHFDISCLATGLCCQGLAASASHHS